MKPHKLAKYFPQLEGEEFEQLKRDIKENGQIEPIVSFEGKILDGLNRYRAIQELIEEGEPIRARFKTFNGNSPLSYVISANVSRRHLNESQRGMLATEMLPELQKEAAKRRGMKSPVPKETKGRAVDHAAKRFGISGQTVSRANRVRKYAPERVADILAGKTSVRAVCLELSEAESRERAKKEIKKEKKKKHEGYHQDVKDYTDALRAFEKARIEAVEAAEFGKFSPEAARFVMNKHAKIANWLVDFDKTLEGISNDLE